MFKMARGLLAAAASDFYYYYIKNRKSDFLSFTDTYFRSMADDSELLLRDSVCRLAEAYGNNATEVRKIFNKIADLMENTTTLILVGTEAEAVKRFLVDYRTHVEEELEAGNVQDKPSHLRNSH